MSQQASVKEDESHINIASAHDSRQLQQQMLDRRLVQERRLPVYGNNNKAVVRKAFAANLRETEHPLLNNLRPGLKGFLKLEDGKYRVWMNNSDDTQTALGDMTTPPPAPGLWSTGSMLLNKRDEVPVMVAVAVYMLRLWGLKHSLFVPNVFDDSPPSRETMATQLMPYGILSEYLPDGLWTKYVKPVLPLGPYYVKGMSDSPRARAKRQYEALSRVLLAGTQEAGSQLAANSECIVSSLLQNTWNEGVEALGIQHSIDIKANVPIKYAQLFDLCRAVVGTNPSMRTATLGGGRRAKWEIIPGKADQVQDTSRRTRSNRISGRSKKRYRKDYVEEEDVLNSQALLFPTLDALSQCITLLYKSKTDHILGEKNASLSEYATDLLKYCSELTSTRYPGIGNNPFPPFSICGTGEDARIEFDWLKHRIEYAGNRQDIDLSISNECDSAQNITSKPENISNESVFSV